MIALCTAAVVDTRAPHAPMVQPLHDSTVCGLVALRAPDEMLHSAGFTDALRESPGLVLCALFATVRGAMACRGATTANSVWIGIPLPRRCVRHVVAEFERAPLRWCSALREHDNWITLYSAAALNFSGEIQTQTQSRTATSCSNASWMPWDLDEWLLVESRDQFRRAQLWRACRRRDSAAISRVEFGAQTLELPPLHLLEPEVQTIEIYTHRRGKTMWRPDPSSSTSRKLHNFHRQRWASAARSAGLSNRVAGLHAGRDCWSHAHLTIVDADAPRRDRGLGNRHALGAPRALHPGLQQHAH